MRLKAQFRCRKPPEVTITSGNSLNYPMNTRYKQNQRQECRNFQTHPFLWGRPIMRSAAARSNLLVPEVREVMDIRQASGYLGISADTLYKYASEGFVPAFKLGNRWRFKRSRLDEWMDRQSDLHAPGAAVDASKKKPVQKEAASNF
jgi:excisionase family DNA binding protein